MPATKYTGSPTGTGNPPGKHSAGYLKNPDYSMGHFVEGKTYKSYGISVGAEKVVSGNPTISSMGLIKNGNDKPLG